MEEKEKTGKPSYRRASSVGVYVATSTATYRFLCDGTHLRLTEGVSPGELEPRQVKELLKYGHIKEVK